MRPLYLSIAKGALLTLVAAVFFITDQPLFMIGSDTASALFAPRASVQVLALMVCAVALWVPVRAAARPALAVLAALAIFLAGHRLLIDNLHHRLADVYLGIPVQILPLNPESEAGLTARWTWQGFFVGPRDTPKTMFIFSPAGIGLNRHDVTRWIS